MTARIAYHKVAPDALAAVFALERQVRTSGLDHSLLHLVKLRASYMNGCAYCVDMHTQDARQGGESEQRLFAIPVWRETPFFTARERAALAWTEVVTELGRAGVSDAAYDAVRREFSETELVHLTLAVVTINVWNRLAVAFRAEVGTYSPGGPG